MKRDDTLWKGILEDLFSHFLNFFFEEADSLFDFKKGFEYLDKEMEQISKVDELQPSKFLDKLVKVYTKKSIYEERRGAMGTRTHRGAGLH